MRKMITKMAAKSRNRDLYLNHDLPPRLDEAETESIVSEIQKTREELLLSAYFQEPGFFGQYISGCRWREDHKKLYNFKVLVKEFSQLEKKLAGLQDEGKVSRAEEELRAYFRQLDRWDLVEGMCNSYIKELENRPPAEENQEGVAKIKILQQKWSQMQNQLLEANQRLLRKIAGDYADKAKRLGASFEDLLQVGSIGYLHAVHEYDSNLSKFSVHTSRFVNGRINCYIRSLEYYHSLQGVSLETPAHGDDGRALIKFYENPTSDNPERETQKKELQERISAALAVLNPREREIMRMLYGLSEEEYIQKEVAKVFGVTKTRIRQLERRALEKLRNSFKVGEADSGNYI